MEEQKSKKKRVRRCTKQDQTPREYKCGCGKGYYSYPALYTHVKLKHEGSIPPGTVVPDNKHYGNRGRPRECKIKEDDQEQHQVFIDEEKRDDQKQTEQVVGKDS